MSPCTTAYRVESTTLWGDLLHVCAVTVGKLRQDESASCAGTPAQRILPAEQAALHLRTAGIRLATDSSHVRRRQARRARERFRDNSFGGVSNDNFRGGCARSS